MKYIKREVGIDVRNSIYIIRLLSKYFIENLSNEQIIDLFNNNGIILKIFIYTKIIFFTEKKIKIVLYFI